MVFPRFLIFVAACLVLLVYFFAGISDPAIETLGHGEFRIYSREKISSPLVTRRIDTATSFIYITSSTNAAALRSKFRHIDGESLRLYTRLSAGQVLERLGKHYVSSMDGFARITYGHSQSARTRVSSNGKDISIQIVEKDGRTIVGWPVLLGGW